MTDEHRNAITLSAIKGWKNSRLKVVDSSHVQVSVRCLFKDDQFSLLVWLLLSLLLLCFHIQKQLILHALAINPSVLIELHLGISNMHHLIVGQVGIKIITSITGGEESNPLWRICLN